MGLGHSIDLGAFKVRAASAKSSKGEYSLTSYRCGEVEMGESPAQAASSLFGADIKSSSIVGVTGADLMMRYLPVPPVDDWRLERLMEFEIREIEERSGAALASSYNLLPVPKGHDDEDTMLLGLVREELLDETIEELLPLKAESYCPNAIALYNAYLALGDHENCTTLIANLGHGTLDLALVNGTDLYFARSVSTSLAKRDQTLASSLGTTEDKARLLIHKHLDLNLALHPEQSVDTERVTRPLLSLYESLPTLLSGVVTLCKAQTRLAELNLDRVLLTGGAAGTAGLSEFLSDRMRVPVDVWNPSDMIDVSALPESNLDQLESDGCGATVAIGLSIGASDKELYALEVLTSSAKKKREFSERGVYNILSGVAAVGFIVLNMVVMGGLAEQAEDGSRSLRREQQKSERNHAEALALIDKISERKVVYDDLRQRRSINDTALEYLAYLENNLPSSLWIESLALQTADGKDWGFEGQRLPIVLVKGRAEEDVRGASKDFSVFTGEFEKFVPEGAQAVKASSNVRGKAMEWSLQAHLLSKPSQVDNMEGE